MGSLNIEPWKDSDRDGDKNVRKYFLTMAFNTEMENSLSNAQMWVLLIVQYKEPW